MLHDAKQSDTSAIAARPPRPKVSEWQHRNPKTGRPCKYPYAVVEYARRLRGFGFWYREISEEIEAKHGIQVPWISVRDWCVHWVRMAG